MVMSLWPRFWPILYMVILILWSCWRKGALCARKRYPKFSWCNFADFNKFWQKCRLQSRQQKAGLLFISLVLSQVVLPVKTDEKRNRIHHLYAVIFTVCFLRHGVAKWSALCRIWESTIRLRWHLYNRHLWNYRYIMCVGTDFVVWSTRLRELIARQCNWHCAISHCTTCSCAVCMHAQSHCPPTSTGQRHTHTPV